MAQAGTKRSAGCQVSPGSQGSSKRLETMSPSSETPRILAAQTQLWQEASRLAGLLPVTGLYVAPEGLDARRDLRCLLEARAFDCSNEPSQAIGPFLGLEGETREVS